MKQTLIAVILIASMWSANNIIEIAKSIDIIPRIGTAMAQVQSDWDQIQAEFATLNHRQRVWLGVLEWCESTAIGTKVNKVDKDGTPSYYWYQFKPETFRAYGEKYELITKGKSILEIKELMKDYVLTIKIMVRMVQDPDVQWTHEFPGCVAKYGPPPKD